MIKLSLNLMSTIFEYSKTSGVLLIIAVACNITLSLGSLYLTKEVTSQIVNGSEFSKYITTIFAIFAVLGVSYVSREILFSSLEIRFHKIGVELESNVHSKFFELDYEDTQNSDIIDEKFKGIHSVSPNNFSVMVKQLGFLFSDFISMIAIIIISVNTSLLLLGLLLIMTFVKSIILIIASKLNVAIWENINVNNRRLSYLNFRIFQSDTVEDIKMYNKENTLRKHYLEYRAKSEKDVKSLNRVGTISSTIIELLDSIFQICIYIYLGLATLNKEVPLDTFAFQIAALISFTQMLNSVVGLSADINRKGLFFKNYKNFIAIESRFKGTKIVPDTSEYEIRFDKVYFKYPNQENFVLEDINISINTGEIVAIVGENGAGKSTFIDLLLRLYKPTKGKILINGVNIDDYSTDSYNTLLSAVFQDFEIYPTSIIDNITLNRGTVDKRKVEEILEDLGVLDALMKLPKGLNTLLLPNVHKDGVSLSGGQLQKIAIARAIYRNSKVVVLDEPTSALDPISERDVYEKVIPQVSDKIGVFITHRLGSVILCDKVIVIRKGKIVEVGSHNELMSSDTYYKELYDIQSHYYETVN